jgi:carboxyl-terminal processing protease
LARLSADAPLDGLILDLRPSGGGTLEALASCIGLLHEGTAGSVRASTAAVIALPAPGVAVKNSRTLPLVVLVHESTLSAAEMTAGTLQYTGRARPIGGGTAGDAGNLIDLIHAGGGCINVTGGTCLLPDGSDPGGLGRGIVPDVAVPKSGWDEFAEEDDPDVARAIEALTLHP